MKQVKRVWLLLIALLVSAPTLVFAISQRMSADCEMPCCKKDLQPVKAERHCCEDKSAVTLSSRDESKKCGCTIQAGETKPAYQAAIHSPSPTVQEDAAFLGESKLHVDGRACGHIRGNEELANHDPPSYVSWKSDAGRAPPVR